MNQVETNDELSIPTAKVMTHPTTSVMSRMWWLSGVCLILAIGLTWASRDPVGDRITIRFDRGHGLAEGDSIRHRGIEIGRVQEVRLMPDLSGIEVTGVLEQHASQVARRGSRFWIVHPQVDFGGVRGLETAIGAKYIRVLPGDGPESVHDFDGMSIAPPNGAEQEGIEVVLRGEDRYGLSAGSPVTFRGIEVGRVLSSRLSPDAKNVDTVVQIVAPHDRLVSKRTKFWKTSGIDIAVSLKGVEFSAQSLATVLRGGVAFATPGPSSSSGDGSANADSDSVEDRSMEGHVFELHEKADSQWLDSQAAINVLSQPIPPTVGVRATWSARTFGFNRTRSDEVTAMILSKASNDESKQGELVLPADLVRRFDSEAADSWKMSLVIDRGTTQESAFDLSSFMQGAESKNLQDEPTSRSLLARIPLSKLTPELVAETRRYRVSRNRIRTPNQPEDCFVVRYAQSSSAPSVSSPGSFSTTSPSTVMLEMIGSEHLTAQEGYWKCVSATLSRDLWHGSPVLSAKDERCLGMLVFESGEVRIATW